MRIKIPVVSKAQEQARFILGNGSEAFREQKPVTKTMEKSEVNLPAVLNFGFATGDPSPIGNG